MTYYIISEAPPFWCNCSVNKSSNVVKPAELRGGLRNVSTSGTPQVITVLSQVCHGVMCLQTLVPVCVPTI
jgi:hypothetical protein